MNDTKRKVALVTGVTGQDGSYLAELLLEKGYEVHGMVRRTSTFNRGRIQHLSPDVHDPQDKQRSFYLHYGDLIDSTSLYAILRAVKPDEIYNLGSQSHVGISFQIPEFTGNVTGLAVMRFLEAIRQEVPTARFYQASSSEMFGLVKEFPQRETTAFHPRSPYGVSKVFAHWATVNYREAYGMHASTGILFNHESPRRGENFVSRKITMTFAKIFTGEADRLYLGNLNAKRDWGYAPDYVRGVWLILQHDKPDDYVLASGENHGVREFVEEVGKLLGYDIVWEGSGPEERGRDRKSGKILVEIDPLYVRPADVNVLIGDYSKAKRVLGWEPKVRFKELVKIMLESDLRLAGVDRKL